MAPILAKNTLVYFLGSGPTEADDKSGEPFGNLHIAEIPEETLKFCSFDNVVRDYTKKPSWQETECCRPLVTKSIETANPKLIIGLGHGALSQVLGSNDLVGMRGRIFKVKIGEWVGYFMPTYDPTDLIKMAYDKKKPLRSRLGHCFKMDLKRAFELAPKLRAATAIPTEDQMRAGIQCFDGSEPGHFALLMGLLQQAKKAEVKAVDIETKGLRPYSKGAAIMSMAISFQATHVAFAWDHPKSKWTDQQKLKIGAEFQRILRDDTIKIAHNAPFELEWFIWLYAKDVVRHDVWEDTMMQAHFIDERKGKQGNSEEDHASPYQKLDFLCKQYFGTSYKSFFKLDKKDMSKSDLGEILIYNGVDTKITLQLWVTQNEIMRELQVYDAYIEALPRQCTVAIMQSLGVIVNQDEIKSSQKKLEGEVNLIMAKIHDLKVVKKYVLDNKEFNPLGEDAIKLFRDYLKRKEVTIVEENNTRYSVDKNVLDKIDHPLAKLIVELRNKSKLKSTYVDGLELGVGDIIYPDGKLHTSFNTTFTETGRLSSSSPNLQNFPKRNDSWVRKSIVPPKGHLMVAVDYGQLEACTGAMCSRDKYLVKALWEDYDIHMEWALKAAHKAPGLIGGKENIKDAKIMKGFRSLIKNKLVFPAFFGAASTSVKRYLTAATEYDVDQGDVDDLMDEFWKIFAGVHSWQDETMRRYYDEGYVTTLTGRRHNYPLTRNQAVNMPIQGAEAELVCDAMNRLSIIASESGNWYMHPVLNVHDDLSFFIPEDEKLLEPALEIIMKQMLKFDYKWINVPLSIEISLGKNWAELEPLGKFWSHRDV
jgi:uracil-DNA glycosylase family 4